VENVEQKTNVAHQTPTVDKVNNTSAPTAAKTVASSAPVQSALPTILTVNAEHYVITVVLLKWNYLKQSIIMKRVII